MAALTLALSLLLGALTLAGALPLESGSAVRQAQPQAPSIWDLINQINQASAGPNQPAEGRRWWQAIPASWWRQWIQQAAAAATPAPTTNTTTASPTATAASTSPNTTTASTAPATTVAGASPATTGASTAPAATPASTANAQTTLAPTTGAQATTVAQASSAPGATPTTLANSTAAQTTPASTTDVPTTSGAQTSSAPNTTQASTATGATTAALTTSTPANSTGTTTASTQSTSAGSTTSTASTGTTVANATTTVANATTATATSTATAGGCEGHEGVSRPHLSSISAGAWDSFQRAIVATKASGVYDRYMNLHRANSANAHGGAHFLVWHRAYLWEFEVELDAAVPGARIPWYDWSSEASPLDNPVWSANRMGSCNVNGSGLIPDGPFAGATWGVTRDGNVAERIPNRAFLTGGINADLDYPAFNNWLEGVHSSFHIAVGGSMGNTGTAAMDPVFFMHHAYVDRLYSEWQTAGGGDEFTGTQGGAAVTEATVMEPFGRTAGSIINGISQCTTYGNGGGSVRTAILDTSERPISSGDDCIPDITEETRESLQEAVAQKKSADPDAYEKDLKEVVDQSQACYHAAVKWGMSPTNVEAFRRTQDLIALRRGLDISAGASN